MARSYRRRRTPSSQSRIPPGGIAETTLVSHRIRTSVKTAKADVIIAKLAVGRVEAAKMLSVHPNTLDRLAEHGLLRPSRATRRPLYPVAELLRFVNETTTTA